ncbi:MAG: 30S ribosomal protein S13, partial [Acidobacteriota bacterium]
MARISGVDLPPNKQVWVGLTYIHGIGRSLAREILAAAKVDPETHV